MQHGDSGNATYNVLPESVQRIADQSYELLKADRSHPSLHFKKLGTSIFKTVAT